MKQRLLAAAIGLAVVSLASFLLTAVWLHDQFSVPVAEGKVIDIRPGASVTGIARQLHAEGLIAAPPIATRLLVALTDSRGQMQTGEYQVEQGMSGYEVLALLRSGKVMQHAVTFPEGWTLGQWRTRLAALTNIEHESLHRTEQELAALLGASTGLEGWLFPDTYHYARGSTDTAILRMAHGAMRQHLAAVWRGRNLGMQLQSQEQALILASIIEKETGYGPDRGKISSVFHNRLQRGMKLQSDPTVIFGLGAEFDGNLKRKHLTQDNVWNTYTRVGLPPGPICSPGLAAIEAALNPAVSDYLYFVAKGDGASHFSRTLREHNRAVDRYQRRRRK